MLDAFRELMKKQRTLLSGLLAVKGGRALIKVVLQLLRWLQAKAPTKSDVRIAKDFAFKIYLMAKKDSVESVIKYLKTCSILLQQYVARHTEHHSTRDIGGVAVSVTRAGLPRIIPKLQRVAIRRGNKKAITLWLSLFNLYRYLECSYTKSDPFKTIVEKGTWLPTTEYSDFIPIFWHKLKRLLSAERVDFHPSLQVRLPQASQSVSVSVTEKMGLKGSSLIASMRSLHDLRFLADAVKWSFLDGVKPKWYDLPIGPLRQERGLSKRTYQQIPKCLDAFRTLGLAWWPELVTLLRGPKDFEVPAVGKSVRTDEGELRVLHTNLSPMLKEYMTKPNFLLTEIWARTIWNLSRLLFGKGEHYVPSIGRLVKLYEPAGKIRVIAIVDPFTNWLLKPLHDWIFGILRLIPQDGTFDQDAPLKTFHTNNKGFTGSCDMSAATDRLPVKLQALILSHIFGPKTANAWKSLLVDRPYKAKFLELYYEVGQPMGALSSWAMLALTHHFMWQFAWYRVYPNSLDWYKNYAVLGDDSVAGDKLVVLEYLKICAELGVKVNLAKSLLSPVGSFEFAKRFYTKFGNCSPASIGELLVADKNFATMTNLARKRKIRISDLLSIMGYRHKVTGSIEKRFISLPKRVRHMFIVVRSPYGPYPTKSLFEWLRLDGWHRSKDNLDLETVHFSVICALDRLRIKMEKVIQVVFFSHFRGGRQNIRWDEEIRKYKRTDPASFDYLAAMTVHPYRRELSGELADLYGEATALTDKLCSRHFLVHEEEVEDHWKEFLDLEQRFFAKPSGDPWLQMVEKPFVEPSPREVVRLYYRLKNGESYQLSKDWHVLRD